MMMMMMIKLSFVRKNLVICHCIWFAAACSRCPIVGSFPEKVTPATFYQ